MEKNLYKENQDNVLVVIGMVYFVLTVIALFLIFFKVSIDSGDWLNWGWIIISLEIIYAVLSLQTVGPTEKGVFLLFGDPLYELKHGLVIVPFLICEALKMPATQQQIQIPADPEFVDKSGDDSKKLPDGMVKPIRATTATPENLGNEHKSRISEEAKNDPLNRRMTVEVSMAIRFVIHDFVKFIKNIGSIKEAIRQMRDTAEAVIKTEVGKRTAYLIISDLKALNDILDDCINKLVGFNADGTETEKAWGIEITDAQIVEIDLGKTINTSQKDVIAALMNKQKTITDAEAKRKETEELGLGTAKAKKASNDVEVDFLKKQAKIAETPGGKFSMAIETAGKAMEKAKITYFQGTGTDIVNTLVKAAEIFKDASSDGGKEKKEVSKT